MNREYFELDTRTVNRYLSNLSSSNTNVVAVIDVFHTSYVDLASELLALCITSSDQEEALKTMAQSLDLFSEMILRNHSKNSDERPLSPAEKVGLKKAIRKTDKNKFLSDLLELEETLKL
jgi:hypothetical protein